MKKNNKGFTLVELLIVVSLTAILSTALLVVIDSKSQNNKARDSVNRAKILDLVDGVWAYYYSEGSFPSSIDFVAIPLLSTYLKEWPEDFDYAFDAGSNEFTITVPKIVLPPSGTQEYFKYDSTWKSIKICDAGNVCY